MRARLYIYTRRADPGVLLRILDWMVYGYFVLGAFDWQAWPANPHDPAHFGHFRRPIYDFTIAMLRLPEA